LPEGLPSVRLESAELKTLDQGVNDLYRYYQVITENRNWFFGERPSNTVEDQRLQFPGVAVTHRRKLLKGLGSPAFLETVPVGTAKKEEMEPIIGKQSKD
jgi:hypothetical protein